MNQNEEVHLLNEKLNSSNLEIPIDWKNEAIRGNCLPAIIKVIRNEIDVDTVIDLQNGNKLLHYSVYYGHLNVTRILIEKFNSNINVRNKFGHTPLHMICNQTPVNMHLFAYLVNNDKINLDSLDKTNVGCVSFAINSHFNLGFLYLANKGVQLYSSDIYSNNLLYWVLGSDNLFVLKYLITHMNFDINCSFYNNSKTVIEFMISTGHRKCTDYIMKYHFEKINLYSLFEGIKKDKFSFYNQSNYEKIRTIYAYRTNSFLMLLKFILFHILFEFEYKATQIYLIGDIILTRTPIIIKLFIYLMNILIKILIFLYFKDIHPKTIFSEEIKTTNYYPIQHVLELILYFLSFITLLLTKSLFSNQNFLYITKKTLNDSFNILNIISNQMEENILELPDESDLCSVCLICTEINVHHCNKCNKCIKDFFFHSIFFNKCFTKNNILAYILYNFTTFSLNLIVIWQIITFTLNTSQYKSDYLSHLIIIIIFSNLFSFISLSLILTQLIINFQRLFLCIYSIGCKSTYYFLFKVKPHKSKIQIRNNDLVFIADSNLVSINEFFQNLKDFIRENLFN